MITVKTIEKIGAELQVIRDKLQEAEEDRGMILSSEETRDYPSEGRLEKIENQITILEDAGLLLEEALQILADYE